MRAWLSSRPAPTFCRRANAPSVLPATLWESTSPIAMPKLADSALCICETLSSLPPACLKRHHRRWAPCFPPAWAAFPTGRSKAMPWVASTGCAMCWPFASTARAPNVAASVCFQLLSWGMGCTRTAAGTGVCCQDQRVPKRVQDLQLGSQLRASHQVPAGLS